MLSVQSLKISVMVTTTRNNKKLQLKIQYEIVYVKLIPMYKIRQQIKRSNEIYKWNLCKWSTEQYR